MIRLATVFSGIGAIEQAFKKMNIEHKIVFACDNGERNISLNVEKINNEIKNLSYEKQKEYIDELYEHRCKKENKMECSYLSNYNLSKKHFYQDVRFLNANRYKGQVDLIVGGSPCQSFSIIGKRAGLKDIRGTLFYDYARIIDECKPKAFIYENVKGLLSHDKGNTWKVVKDVFMSLGYNIKFYELNSKDFGIPQDRRRIFLVGTLKENLLPDSLEKQKLTKTMFDFLDTNVDAKYYFKQKGFEFVTTNKRARINSKVISTQKANQQFNWNGDFVFEEYDTIKNRQDILDNAYIGYYNNIKGVARKLTPRECLRLMGFDDTFKIVVDDVEMYRQAGNSIVVNVLEEILKQLLKYKMI